MAYNLSKAPSLRKVATRGYANLAPVSGIQNYEIKSSTLPNKLIVVSAENQSPISRVSVVVKAGPRYESGDNVGVSHVLRACAGLSTKNATQFLITRSIQQVGASLTAVSDRETISYTLEGTRGAVEKVLPFLSEVVAQQAFRPWEVAEISNRLKLDLATRPLQLRCVDLFHKAAFRRGLGNSLFVPKFQIGKISSETLQHFVQSTFSGGRAAVVGLGVDEAVLGKFAQGLKLGSGEGCSTPSPYKGGEVRSDKGGDLAFVAVGGAGASVSNAKEAAAFAVLQKAVSPGPQIKWSSSDSGALSKALGPNEDVAACAINASYSDVGIFGVLIAAPAKCAAKPVEAAVKFIRCGNVSDEDVNRGKNLLKVETLSKAESGSNLAQCLGRQAVLTGAASSASEAVSVIDSVTTADVQSALKKVQSGKLTVAAVGNLTNVPYLDELA